MVSTFTIIGLVFTTTLCFGFPIASYIFLRRKGNYTARAIGAGMLSFFLFQIVLRIPLLQLIGTQDFYIELTENHLAISLVLGFTAALYETVGRLVFMKLILRGKESYHTGLAHGVGHGGIEAILLVGVNYIIYILFSFMINAGTFEVAVLETSTGLALEQFTALRDTLIDSSSGLFFVSGIERLFTMVIHIGLSVLLMEGIARRKVLKYFLLVLLIHTALDFSVSYMGLSEMSIWIIELMVLAFSIGLGVYVLKAKSRFPIEE